MPKFLPKITRLARFALLATLLINLMGSASLAMASTSTRASSVEVDAVDTVAGYSALIRAFNAPSNTDLEIKIEKPDGAEIILKTTTDRTGKTKLDLEGFYTKKAGIYTVEARVQTRDEAYGTASTFQVYADTLSPSRSLLQLNRQTASANGNDAVEVQVTLFDKYANPLSGHTVQIISSRKSDEIVRISSLPYTNEQGRMAFSVYSRQAGVSTLIVNDTTANMTLNERGEIAFYSPSENPLKNERGGDTNSPRVYFASTSQSGPVSYLSLENLAETVKIGETQSITILAMDSQSNVAGNYTGTIHFSSTDNNATLPNDYTFEAEDQGQHTFSLGATFKTMGTQTLTVTDIDMGEIFAETEVEVTSTGSGNGPAYGEPIVAGDLTVMSPVVGTYSSDNLTFSGEAPYGMKIEIYENDVLKGEIEVEPEGIFTGEIKNIENGDHEFVVKTVDEEGETVDETEPFLVTIDTDAPQVDKVEIAPNGDIPAGAEFEITVYSEPNLPQVAAIFNNGVFQLEEDAVVNGNYHGTLQAPETQEEYEVDILVVDDLGNEILYNKLAKVTVGEPNEEEAIAEEEVLAPGQVASVEGVKGDSKVTLSWEAPAAIEGETPVDIDHYRIYYGPDAELLYSTVDTQDNSPTWRVENLQNGTTYYFAVVAITAEGVESLQRSATVSMMPESDDTALLFAAAAEEAARKAQAEALAKAMTADESVDTGPEILWLMSFSGGLSGLYFGRKRKKKVVFHDIR